LVDIGGGGRRGVIGRLRRAFGSSRARARADRRSPGATRAHRGEAERRLEAARVRLKARIPPPEEG
jgi:hypothetical protein